MHSNHKNTKQNIITIEVEDYFHVGTFHRNIRRSNWYRFEKRIEQNTHKALDLLDQYNIKATFFVLGWVADMVPEVVTEIASRGHEIASKGYNHRTIYQLSREEFRDELQQGREALERVSKTRVHGYRVAHRWLTPADLWVLDVLADEGYSYDSSIGLIFRRFARQPWRGLVHEHVRNNNRLWEFPLSSLTFAGYSLPISGGNYYRQFPYTFLKHAVEHWHRKHDQPFVMYFHIWELDPEQPKINSGSFVSNIRHYRNLNKMSWVLKEYFQKYSFTSIANYLQLDLTIPDSVSRSTMKKTSELSENNFKPRNTTASSAKRTSARAKKLTNVTIVVPCYNEESNLKYLSNTLRSMQNLFRNTCNLHFIFVDDCSGDKTRDLLKQLFGSRSDCTVLSHPINLGVAAAILTGIRRAATEIVCSIDCDCTYDPHELENMIPMLSDNVDLVTASPYHAKGNVFNVPRWRLFLSKTASWLYKKILRQDTSTYTSCFRVYRRSAIIKLRLKKAGYLGIAEMTGLLYLQGSNIVEYPTTLEARLLGTSSMKIMKTIVGHLKLMIYLLTLRLFKARDGEPLRETPPSVNNKEISSFEVSPLETNVEKLNSV